MPATKDGRCWPCVQRRRWYAEAEVVAQPEHAGLRHLATVEGLLCVLPRRQRHRDPAVQRAYRQDYDRRRAEANPEGYRWARQQVRYGGQLRRAYGLTWPGWEALYVLQAGHAQDDPARLLAGARYLAISP